jgi:hypothetical protein
MDEYMCHVAPWRASFAVALQQINGRATCGRMVELPEATYTCIMPKQACICITWLSLTTYLLTYMARV